MDPSRSLASTDHRPEPRGATQGLPADVCAPHHHREPDDVQLRAQLDSSWQRDPRLDGLCRHPPSCEPILKNTPSRGSLTSSWYRQLAKLFVYTKKPLAADITFGTFMLAWIATRHVLYGIVLWSVYFELPSMLPYDWRPQDGYFNSFYSHQAFFGLLLALQLIIIVWFTMICRVAYRAVTGRGVDDERSEAGYVLLLPSSFPLTDSMVVS